MDMFEHRELEPIPGGRGSYVCQRCDNSADVSYPFGKVAVHVGGVLLIAAVYFVAFVYRVPDPTFLDAAHHASRPLLSAGAPTTSTTTTTTRPR